MGLLPAAPHGCDEAALRQSLLASGILHYVWAQADLYRLDAAAALDQFASVGGDAAPLLPMLALSAELRFLPRDDT
jgi:hypothetical protein